MRLHSLSVRALALPFLLVGCDGKAPDAVYAENTDPTIDPNTDSDADTDTDTDSDTDADADTDTDTAVPTLYEQLGGQPAVEAVVTTFINHVAADTTINFMFANTDLDNLSQMLQDQICSATGGGCTYTGGSMAEVHAGMAITDDQFNALVGDLLAALDELGVPYSATLDGSETIDPLLVALVGMHDDIVTDADGSAVLFNQLGGHAAVEAVIDGMLTNVAADSRINGFFTSVDLAHLNDLLVEQVCEATGGFCVYSGRTMLETHTGLNITDDDFNALVEDYLASLDSLGVPYTSPNFDGGLPADTLTLALAGMHDDIVGH